MFASIHSIPQYRWSMLIYVCHIEDQTILFIHEKFHINEFYFNFVPHFIWQHWLQDVDDVVQRALNKKSESLGFWSNYDSNYRCNLWQVWVLLWDFISSLTKRSPWYRERLDWELPITESCVEPSSVHNCNSEGYWTTSSDPWFLQIVAYLSEWAVWPYAPWK